MKKKKIYICTIQDELISIVDICPGIDRSDLEQVLKCIFL